MCVSRQMPPDILSRMWNTESRSGIGSSRNLRKFIIGNKQTKNTCNINTRDQITQIIFNDVTEKWFLSGLYSDVAQYLS